MKWPEPKWLKFFHHCNTFSRSHFHHCLVFCSWQQRRLPARLSILLNRPLSNRKKRVLLNRLIMTNFFVAREEKGTRLRIEDPLFKSRKKGFNWLGNAKRWLWWPVSDQTMLSYIFFDQLSFFLLHNQEVTTITLKKITNPVRLRVPLFCPQMIPNLRCWLKPER